MHALGVALVVALLVAASAICSGLNVALMSLEPADLRRKAKLGNRQAAAVLPFRKNTHLTLASILLANVAVISATSLVLGDKFNGLVAGIGSTLLIVVFGEVIPQALFASRALGFCAFFAPLLQLMVIVTYPISRPLQMLLDRWLGSEHTRPLQSRHELGLLIGEHAHSEESELDEDELRIIQRALSLSEKRVRDIMTPIRQVYWLTPETLLDGQKATEAKAQGWSRIPILDPQRTRAYGVLMMKTVLERDNNADALPASDLPLHPIRTVGSMTALDTLLRKFIVAHSHLMAVEKDDLIVGIVTIEDLLEEIIGHEIEDERDRAHAKAR